MIKRGLVKGMENEVVRTLHNPNPYKTCLNGETNPCWDLQNYRDPRPDRNLLLGQALSDVCRKGIHAFP